MIRQFFLERQVLEVETPLLAPTIIAHPHLAALDCPTTLQGQAITLYLQPSPEAAMKRLLAAGSGSIYQITKAFRQDENSRYHNPEFTLLEWYRIDFDHHALMSDINDLLACVLPGVCASRLSYQDLFWLTLNIDPLTCDLTQLIQCAEHHQLQVHDAPSFTRDDWLNLLLSHLLEPKLGLTQPIFIYDYPASQADLAIIKDQEHALPIAERFELYYQGIELANGYHELTCARELQTRFDTWQDLREQQGLKNQQDSKLLAAMKHLPACAGVALGLDRLLMCISNCHELNEVLSFPLAIEP